MAEPTFRLLPIRATAFQNVLNRLGAAPNMGGFALDTIVTPVSLVDSDITLNAAASTPLVNVPASAGELVAPAANTRLATTGPLPAGPYTMVFWFGCTEGATTTFRIRRRNAGDTADIWSHRFAGSGAAPPFYSVALRLLLALNEFVTVENPSAGGVGSIYQGTIFFTAG